MRIRILSVLLGLIAQPSLAMADDFTDCISRDAEKAIAGCTGIIDDQSLSSSGRARALSYRGDAYHGKWHLPEALDDFSRSIALAPTSEAYAGRGLVYQDQHELERSFADLTQALRIDPKSASAYRWRGLSYFYNHDNEHAITNFSTPRCASIPLTATSIGTAGRRMRPPAIAKPRSLTTLS